MSKKIITILIIFIVIFSFFLRTYRLTDIPSGFFADEASIGYNAYTLLASGKDEAGNKFPILFNNFSTFYRPGISIYLSSIFVYFFGLNEFSLRLTSAIIGTLTVIIIFYLARIIFNSNGIAILTAIFLAISPWHIHFSRINQEFIYFVFFLSLSILLFLTGINKGKSFFMIISFCMFGITLYTYVPAYFLVPLFITFILYIYKDDVFKTFKKIFICLGLLLFISLPLIWGLTNNKTMSRYNQLTKTDQQRPRTEILKKTFSTYIDHFLPEFLFIKGDIEYPGHFITRFSVKGMGQLYWFQLPLILIGFMYAKKKNKKGFLLIISWLTLYPLGSTLVPFADGGGPFANRSIIGIVPFQILSACGLYMLIEKISKIKKFSLVLIPTIIIVIFLSFLNYINLYFLKYPLYSSDLWGWQYGARDIVKYFELKKSEYDELIMAPEFNAPEIFFKFYAPNNCLKCKIGLPQNMYNSNIKQLFAITPSYLQNNPSINFLTLKTIYYPNNNIAFIIGKVVK